MSVNTRTCDVAVVGAGLGGTSVARILMHRGYDVALVDTRAVYPKEFRAEKLGEPQMEQFEALGLGDSVRAVATPMDDLWIVRFGRIVTREAKREYGFNYADLVNRLRADLPVGGALTVGRVEDIVPGPDRQTIVLADGRHIAARLVVVSTGLGHAIRRKVGVDHTVVSPRHSLSLGFDMGAPRSAFPFETLTYYAESFGTRAAYLTLFPIGSVMRANLFVYREPDDAWAKAFRASPEAELAALLPNLRRVCPSTAVHGPVEVRPIDLIRVEDPARDGVVLIGDAHSTACPIPGTGIGKVLVDIDRLCSVHVPRWMSLPRIDRGAVAAFYADPVKAANDAASLRAGGYARDFFTRSGPAWSTRRARHFVSRHIRHLWQAGSASLAGRAASARPAE